MENHITPEMKTDLNCIEEEEGEEQQPLGANVLEFDYCLKLPEEEMDKSMEAREIDKVLSSGLLNLQRIKIASDNCVEIEKIDGEESKDAKSSISSQKEKIDSEKNKDAKSNIFSQKEKSEELKEESESDIASEDKQ